MKQIQFDFTTSDSLELFGQGWFPDSAPDAVINLVHGLGEHSGRYQHLAKYFIGENIAVLSFDLRGHGQSAGTKGYTPQFDFLLDDISRFLDESKNRFPGLPAFIYGHSLGGLLVLSYLLRETPEVKGAIVTDPFLRTAFKPPALKIFAAKILDKISPKMSLSNEVDPNGLSHDKEVVQKYIDDPLVHDKLTPRLGIAMLRAGEQALQDAAQLKIPLLLMHGNADPITSCDASKEFAERAGSICTLHLWEGMYHEIHNEPEHKKVFTYELEWIRNQLTHSA